MKRILDRVENAPIEIDTWTKDKQYKWFASKFEQLLPMHYIDEHGTISFIKMMQIKKIMAKPYDK